MKLDTSNEVGHLTLHHMQKGTQNKLIKDLKIRPEL